MSSERARRPRSPRSERIELRATAEETRSLARAAAAERIDLTAFVLRAALPAGAGGTTAPLRLRRRAPGSFGARGVA